MGRIPFFFSEAFRALRRNGAPTLAAVITTVVTVVLLGVLIPVFQTAQAKSDEVQNELDVNFALFDGTTNAEVAGAKAKVEAIPGVESVTYVSKQEALKTLRSELNNKSILEQLHGNPLPASLKVQAGDASDLNQIKQEVMGSGGAGAASPISPAISNSFTRRREVEVMRLVGATRWFIRWPFLIEGVVVGFLGGAVAILILWIGKITIVDPLSSGSQDAFVSAQHNSTLAFPALMAILFGAAILVSTVGSGVTLRRFLRV